MYVMLKLSVCWMSCVCHVKAECVLDVLCMSYHVKAECVLDVLCISYHVKAECVLDVLCMPC